MFWKVFFAASLVASLTFSNKSDAAPFQCRVALEKLLFSSKAFDSEVVDSIKAQYVERLEKKLKIDPPNSNEEKIALLEATELVFQMQSDPVTLPYTRKMQGKRLLKLLSKWKPGEKLSKDTFEEIMDLHYIAANTSTYSIKNIGDIVSPNWAIRRLVRDRWTTELARTDLISALENLNILSPSESKWVKARKGLGTAGYWANNSLLNISALFSIHFPIFFPKISTLSFVKPSETYDQFYNRAKTYAGIDHYARWTKKFYPFLVAGVVALYGANTTADMNLKQGQYEKDHMVTVTNLPTRDQLESLTKQEMIDEFTKVNHTPPSSNQVEQIEKAIQSMHLQELASFIKQAKSSK